MHQLQVLDRLVSEALAVIASAPGKQQVISHNSLFSQALKEAAGLRKSLVGQALSANTKKEMRLVIQKYQIFSIVISNRLFAGSSLIRQLPYNPVALKQMLIANEEVQQCLLDLLQFLSSGFTEFFSTHQAMPAVQVESAVNEIQARQNAFIASCPSVGSKLLGYINGVVNEFTSIPAGLVSYHEYECIRRYLTCLELNADGLQQEPWETFLEICININYIPAGFLNQYLSVLSEQLVMETPGGLRQFWEKLLLRFTQAPVYINTGNSSVKSLVLATLRRKVGQLPNPSSGFPVAGNLPGRDKIFQTSMSVSQLAIFLRILDKSGAFKSSNHSAMLKAVASSVHTAKATAISPDSLRAKYYSSDPASVSIVKEYVINMMNQLRQY